MSIILPDTQNIIKPTTKDIILRPSVSGPVVPGSSFLSDAWAGIDGHFDSTIVESYGGSGTTWTDVIAGNTATIVGSPTFSGTAGSSDGRFVLNGSSYFTMDSNPSELAAMARTDTGSDFTFITVQKYPSSGVIRALANSQGSPNEGFAWIKNVTTDTEVLSYYAPVFLGNNITATGTSAFAGTYVANILVLSADRTGATIYSNSTTGFTATRSAFSITVDSPQNFVFDVNQGLSVPSPSGTERLTIAWGVGSPDSSQRSAIFTALNTAHGRTYV